MTLVPYIVCVNAADLEEVGSFSFPTPNRFSTASASLGESTRPTIGFGTLRAVLACSSMMSVGLPRYPAIAERVLA